MNSATVGDGIMCRILLIEFHRRRGLSEFSEIYHMYTHDPCNQNDLDLRVIYATLVQNSVEGFYPLLFPKSSMEWVVFWVLYSEKRVCLK